MNLKSLSMFVLVVQHAGFSEASRKHNIPVATLSRHLTELENDLGIRLLERTTRNIRTTREGDILYQYALRGLDEIRAGKLALLDRAENQVGTLRISIPPNLNFWWDLLREFQADYGNISIEILTTERRLDLIADGIDVAVRVGEVETQSAVARKIMEYRHVLVYSPKFADRYGIPENVDQLSGYSCGAWNNGGSVVNWKLAGKNYAISPKLKVNDYAQLLNLALAGEMIIELTPQIAQPHLESGQLITLFPELTFPLQSLHLVYPSRKHISAIARTYIEFAVAYCQEHPAGLKKETIT